MLAWIPFLVICLVLIFGALMVVWSEDLVHTVLWLAICLIFTAVAYVALVADFLAAAQILLYTGGLVTLLLFAVMLTRRLQGAAIVVDAMLGGWKGPVVGLATFGLVALAVLRSPSMGPAPAMSADTQALGQLVLTDLLLPFEALSVLLLAAMVGAIVLARRDSRPTIPTLKRRGPPGGDA